MVWICVHVNCVDDDELLQQQKETTIGELKVFIAGEFQRIKTRLDKIEVGLKKIDADIRGNGRVGINVQLDRLEKAKHAALWIGGALATALLAGLIAHYFSLIEKWIGK